MSNQSRKHRGYRTQKVVAEYLEENGWPFAESTGGGRSGVDVTGTPGIAIEVKARTGFSPLAWVKQAEQETRGGVPIVVFRCNGQGEDAAKYPAMLRFSDLVNLLREAGYGSDESQQGN